MWEAGGSTGLVFDAPGWMWALGLAVAVGMAVLLYGWARTPGLNKAGRAALAALRGFAVAGIVLLLIGPLMKHLAREVEVPHAAILLDTSASVALDADSAEVEALSQFALGLADALSDQTFTTTLLPFAATIDAPLSPDGAPAFAGRQTDFGGALENLAYRYEGQNLAGVVVLTDGRSNRGVNPEFGARLPLAPLLTIGLGDTTRRADRAIDRVDWNRIAYLDNQFPVEAVVALHGETGPGSAEVTLTVDGEVVGRERVVWPAQSGSIVRRLQFKATASRVGNLPCSITIAPSPAEHITANNRQSFSIEVLEKRRQILILGAAPHPDIAAIHNAFARSDRYSTDVRIAGISPASGMLGKLDDLLASADLIVLHDLPGGSTRGQDWVEQAEATGKPRLHVVSAAGLESAGGLAIPGMSAAPNGLTHNVRPGSAGPFDLFDIPKGFVTSREDLPPLTCPMGEFALSPAWRLGITRSLGGLNTGEALAAFRDSDGTTPKLGLVLGTGWWRLRAAQAARFEPGFGQPSVLPFDAFFQNAVQFLTSEDDVRQFRVTGPRRVDEDLAIQFKAEVYDAALNPLPGAEVLLTLASRDDPGTSFDFVFTESGANNSGDAQLADVSYALDCGRLPAGDYRWEARTLLDGRWVETTGELSINEIHVEYASDPADHGLLVRLAERTGGQYLGQFEGTNPADLATAVATWFASNRPPDLIFEEITFDEIIEWEWIGLIVLGLLTVEWVIRRRTIGY